MKTEREYAVEIIRAAGPGATIIELGAHHGNDTVVLYDAAFSPVSYIAVEADPRNVSILSNRVGHRYVQVIRAAIWDKCELVTLYLSEGHGNGSSSVREPLEHVRHFPHIAFNHTTEVQAITLDAIAADCSGVDLIWCDIQGAERNMIAGGRATLARTKWLLTECDRFEMYAGQATRDELLEILGPDWELVAEWRENANLLLRNRKLA